ncbi:hypothetical protein [Usitatibacter palustris]|uniref:Argininosuccinate lyase n=1 Tax=Usitatibacter palustris TaxID=2732487 RepID=A0A6M4H4P7_9PROT|nr:hypothetical protein [Usitatibacter palustris]QJR14611.1 hypothetical protein DSM104440_01418 [Usitatibacter palustris]
MKLRTFGLMLTAAASLGAGPSFAGDSEVMLANNSGHAIREVYLSPAGQNQWGGDRFQDNAAMENGTQIVLKFGARLACVQDMKVVFADNNAEAVMTSLDMCAISKVNLKFDPKTRTTIALKQ